MKILAIETSCDETAIALVEASGELKRPKFKILKNFVASQITIHRPFGGIVPNLAKREHLRNLPILLNKLIKTNSSKSKLQIKFQKFFKTINLIAITIGPGLEPALWTGINFAKEIYNNLKPKTQNLKPKIIGVSHLEGHLYSFLLNSKSYKPKAKSLFPAIALIVSGGHTTLLLMEDLTRYKKLGETRDDAVGEAFDKVARLLNLPYPGGPEIEKLAKKGNPDAIHFPRPMIEQKNYDFSFSGLKTAVLYYMRDKSKAASGCFHSAALRPSGHGVPPTGGTSEAEAPVSELAGRANGSEKISTRCLSDVAASFQIAAFEVLVKKTLRAAGEFRVKSIMISGGVAANRALAREFRETIKFQLPIAQLLITEYPTDNAAMIAVAGYVNYLRGKKRKLVANGNLSL